MTAPELFACAYSWAFALPLDADARECAAAWLISAYRDRDSWGQA